MQALREYGSCGRTCRDHPRPRRSFRDRNEYTATIKEQGDTKAQLSHTVLFKMMLNYFQMLGLVALPSSVAPCCSENVLFR